MSSNYSVFWSWSQRKSGGEELTGRLIFSGAVTLRDLKKLAWKSECFSPNVDLPFACFTYEPRLVSLKSFMGAMAEPLSFMHHDHCSSSERSDDSPSAVSEDDSSGICGHISPPDPDWTEERFRVDRKKLETMLLGMLTS